MESAPEVVASRQGSGDVREDRALWRRAVAGDRAAVDELVRESYPSLYRTAFRLLGNPEDAEDLAQEALVRACRSLHLHRGESSLLVWMRRIVVHLAHDRFRRAGRRPEDLGLPAEFLAGTTREPSERLQSRELVRALARAVQELPSTLRIALVLRTLEGLEYDEIAAATGVTPATARTQVMKARRSLQRVLAPHLDPDRERSRR